MATSLASNLSKPVHLGRASRHSVCYAVGMLRWSTCALLLVAGCYSPTLPLPPPAAPSEESAGTNQVHLHGAPGSALANVTIIIENQYDPQFTGNQQVMAALTRSDGSWDATVFAVKNDLLVIYEIEGDELGQPLDFQVMVN